MAHAFDIVGLVSKLALVEAEGVLIAPAEFTPYSVQSSKRRSSAARAAFALTWLILILLATAAWFTFTARTVELPWTATIGGSFPPLRSVSETNVWSPCDASSAMAASRLNSSRPIMPPPPL